MVDVSGHIDGGWNDFREKISTGSDLREISRVLLLRFSGKRNGRKTAGEEFVLDTAFPLIEGAPVILFVEERSKSMNTKGWATRLDWSVWLDQPIQRLIPGFER